MRRMRNTSTLRFRSQQPGRETLSAGECRYFTYNDVNLAETIQYPGGVANYFWYDAMMRRYAMQDSSGLRYFTWDQNGMNLLCERDNAGSMIAYYTHGYTPVDGIGSMVAAKQNRFSATYYQYPVYDHRGTVVRLLNDNGAVSAYYEYDAWGNVLRGDTVSGISENRFRYQSNYVDLADSDGALALSPTRMLHKATGRFLGREPSAMLSGDSSYCDGRVTEYVDADGLRASLVGPALPGPMIIKLLWDLVSGKKRQQNLPPATSPSPTRLSKSQLERLLKPGNRSWWIYEDFGFLDAGHSFIDYEVTKPDQATKAQADAWNAGDLYAFMKKRRVRKFDTEIAAVKALADRLSAKDGKGCTVIVVPRLTKELLDSALKNPRQYVAAAGHGARHSIAAFHHQRKYISVVTTKHDAIPARFLFATCDRGRMRPDSYIELYRLLLKDIKTLHAQCEADRKSGSGCGVVFAAAGPHYSFWATPLAKDTDLAQVWDTWWKTHPPKEGGVTGNPPKGRASSGGG